MTDILSVLDAAIEELGQKRRPSLGSSREPDATGTGTGTPKALKKREVPVLPVIPAANDDVDKEITISSKNDDGFANNRSESGSKIYPFKNTGSTGSTGTGEDFCGLPSSRASLANGNYGNSSGADARPAPLRQEYMSDLVEQGLFIDFETRSSLDLPRVGSFVYADHGSTEVWVACYAIGIGPVRIWYPGDPVPTDLDAHVRAGLPLVAHNATFERTIWANIMTPRHGWPEPDLVQWHCTAAMALPRNLEDAARVMGCSFQKDMEGRRLMLQMSRPLSSEKRTCVFCGAAPGQPRPSSCLCEPGRDWRTQVTWKDDQESIKRGTEYCICDIETEPSC